MTEHITDKQIEQLFKLADEIIRAPSRFTKDFVVENLGLGVADLCGVIDRLRAQLAEIGNFTVHVDFQADSDNDAFLRFLRQAIRFRRDYENGEER